MSAACREVLALRHSQPLLEARVRLSPAFFVALVFTVRAFGSSIAIMALVYGIRSAQAQDVDLIIDSDDTLPSPMLLLLSARWLAEAAIRILSLASSITIPSSSLKDPSFSITEGLAVTVTLTVNDHVRFMLLTTNLSPT